MGHLFLLQRIFPTQESTEVSCIADEFFITELSEKPQRKTTQPLKKKKDEKMSFAAIWIDLEIIILSEVSRKEKD